MTHLPADSLSLEPAGPTAAATVTSHGSSHRFLSPDHYDDGPQPGRSRTHGPSQSRLPPWQRLLVPSPSQVAAAAATAC